MEEKTEQLIIKETVQDFLSYLNEEKQEELKTELIVICKAKIG